MRIANGDEIRVYIFFQYGCILRTGDEIKVATEMTKKWWGEAKWRWLVTCANVVRCILIVVLIVSVIVKVAGT